MSRKGRERMEIAAKKGFEGYKKPVSIPQPVEPTEPEVVHPDPVPEPPTGTADMTKEELDALDDVEQAKPKKGILGRLGPQ